MPSLDQLSRVVPLRVCVIPAVGAVDGQVNGLMVWLRRPYTPVEASLQV
jgi:hypothetical protein